MIAVDVLHVNEIQRFITYADPYQAVGGFWRLSYPGKRGPEHMMDVPYLTIVPSLAQCRNAFIFRALRE